MKRGTFKKLTYQEAIEKRIEKQRNTPPRGLKLTSKRTKTPKRDLMPQRVKRAKLELVALSHTFVRKRDGINGEIKGYCFDCGTYAEGRHFQAGHFKADSVGGAILRYHPHNMHGQASGCNMAQRQETVKINYTIKMQEKYGVDYVNHLLNLKPNMQFKADIIFYENLIMFYKYETEQRIVDFLESLC